MLRTQKKCGLACHIFIFFAPNIYVGLGNYKGDILAKTEKVLKKHKSLCLGANFRLVWGLYR